MSYQLESYGVAFCLLKTQGEAIYEKISDPVSERMYMTHFVQANASSPLVQIMELFFFSLKKKLLFGSVFIVGRLEKF